MSWKRIRQWERRHLPNPPRKRRGATQRVLDAARAAILELPDDYLACMRDTDGSASPVFGAWTVSSLRELPRNVGVMAEHLNADDDGRYRAEGPVRAVYWHPRWIPVAYDGSGDHLCLDLAPAPGGTVGQVIVFHHDQGHRRVLAASFSAWLEQLADRLESGQLAWDADAAAVLPAASAPRPGDGTLAKVTSALVERLSTAESGDAFGVPGMGTVHMHVRAGHSGGRFAMPTIRRTRFRPTPALAQALHPDADGDALGDVAWLEAAGIPLDACQRAFEAALEPLACDAPVALPGLGRLEAFRGRGHVFPLLKLSPAARSVIDPR